MNKPEIQIGDKVAAIDDTTEGIVINISGNSVEFVDEHGFAIRYEKHQLIKIDNSDTQLTANQNHALLEEKVQADSKKKSTAKISKKHKGERVLEVDLHIENLVDSTRGMDNYDMLSLQLKTAQKKLEFAKNKKIQKVVFIHGVGKGVLKEELELLFRSYSYNYYPASFKEYGSGATEVLVF